jgi:hypothetical protein
MCEHGSATTGPLNRRSSFLGDLFNAPRLPGGGRLGLRQTSSGPMGVGSSFQGRRVLLDPRLDSTYVITELDPPYAVGFSITGRPLRSCLRRWTLETIAQLGSKLGTTNQPPARPA